MSDFTHSIYVENQALVQHSSLFSVSATDHRELERVCCEQADREYTLSSSQGKRKTKGRRVIERAEEKEREKETHTYTHSRILCAIQRHTVSVR